MARIFLCYRSIDEAYAAALVDQRLSEVFGKDDVFRASRSIFPGERYPEMLLQALKACEFMLVIVGPGWASAIDEDGKNRLDNEDDWVRREVAIALQDGKVVIPVLLTGASRLHERQLPEAIRALAHIQYVYLHYRDVEAGLAAIISALSGSDADRIADEAAP